MSTMLVTETAACSMMKKDSESQCGEGYPEGRPLRRKKSRSIINPNLAGPTHHHHKWRMVQQRSLTNTERSFCRGPPTPTREVPL
ncbi:hypothetical protein AGOR_G00099500 [Albula goreensis]|uniref:Uncharacterized protein n=1 Tax=Albula goreensis TaxID=1534307 RepID=A0A8T3DPK3_9TELE|nr:hypothetical protein AGOR_G00099500 [Albula goreensis]